MSLKHVTIDVSCHWNESPAPVYRLYVNEDLLTERTFVWPGYKNYIRENIVLDVNPGIHTVWIENVSNNGAFVLDNLSVEGRIGAEHPNYHDPLRQYIKFVTNY